MTTAPAQTVHRSVTPMLIGVVLLLTALVVNQAGIWTQSADLSTLGQLTMSGTATLIVALYTGGITRVLGTIAMVACFAGDLLPRFMSEESTTLAMIGAFAVGQLFLVAAFWRWVDWHLPRTKVVAGVLAAYAVGLLTYLAALPGIERSLLGPMTLYAVLLVLMAVTASVHPVALAGALCFIISDSILGARLLGAFVYTKPASSAVMVFYGLALLLLAIGLVRQYQQAER
ncbi:lysoplasmalogenase family protein [Propionibacteriaceae bacterium Y1923]|uniref:lysoplasmalogenase family protein n=1 Tax=Aestuariimicrobium sp. Y1814 TaxID=3418742 RepID=UPI003C277883